MLNATRLTAGKGKGGALMARWEVAKGRIQSMTK